MHMESLNYYYILNFVIYYWCINLIEKFYFVFYINYLFIMVEKIYEFMVI